MKKTKLSNFSQHLSVPVRHVVNLFEVIIIPVLMLKTYSCRFPIIFQAIAEERLELSLLTPESDQNRISPYKNNTIWIRQVMRIKKMSIQGLNVDPIPISPKQIHKYYKVDGEENF